jgi:hypothetical protein
MKRYNPRYQPAYLYVVRPQRRWRRWRPKVGEVLGFALLVAVWSVAFALAIFEVTRWH